MSAWQFARAADEPALGNREGAALKITETNTDVRLVLGNNVLEISAGAARDLGRLLLEIAARIEKRLQS
jgi:hypothetical protein